MLPLIARDHSSPRRRTHRCRARVATEGSVLASTGRSPELPFGVTRLLAVVVPLKSCGSSNRRIVFRMTFAKFGGTVELPAKSVRKPMGSTMVTLMPSGATSRESTPEKPSTPHFAAEQGPRPGAHPDIGIVARTRECQRLTAAKPGSSCSTCGRLPCKAGETSLGRLVASHRECRISAWILLRNVVCQRA